MSVLKEITKHTWRTTKWAYIGGIIYIGLLIGVQEIPTHFSPKIQTQNQLGSILKQEMKKLGADKNIKIRFGNEGPYSALVEINKNRKPIEYEIVLPKSEANLSILKHELYHIMDGHCDNTTKSDFVQCLKYLLWYEPQAVIYQTTSLKL